MKTSFNERFWSRVKRTDSCWLWIGAINGEGYGLTWHKKRVTNAHRVSWEMVNGEIPKGMNVLHHCDVRNCINPAHLYIGTQKENRRDADIRGRTRLPKGQDHPKTHLTDTDVLYIRSHFKKHVVTMQMLADKFGVSKPAIADIIYRRNWRHILPLDSL